MSLHDTLMNTWYMKAARERDSKPTLSVNSLGGFSNAFQRAEHIPEHVARHNNVLELCSMDMGTYLLKNKKPHTPLPAKEVEAVLEAPLKPDHVPSDEEKIQIRFNEGLELLSNPRLLINEDEKGVLSRKDLIEEVSKVYALTGSKVVISKPMGGKGKGGNGSKLTINGVEIGEAGSEHLPIFEAEIGSLKALKNRSNGVYRKMIELNIKRITEKIKALKKPVAPVVAPVVALPQTL